MKQISDEEKARFAADLVHRIGKGETEAEEELVEHYSRSLLLMLRHQTGNPDLSDDLHQETFCLVLSKIRDGKVREPKKLAAFIHRVAVNLLIAGYRKERRRAPLFDEQAPETVLDRKPDPFTQLYIGDEARLVRAVLAELKNERDRQVLVRFYLAEEDKDRIRTDLGLDPLQFNLVLHRARQRFAELWRKRTNPTQRARFSVTGPAVTFFLIFLEIFR